MSHSKKHYIFSLLPVLRIHHILVIHEPGPCFVGVPDSMYCHEHCVSILPCLQVSLDIDLKMSTILQVYHILTQIEISLISNLGQLSISHVCKGRIPNSN